MRPVNLIPPEERRGDRAPLRAGSLSYVVIGALAAVLAGVVLLVTTGNTITERKGDVTRLQGELASAQQQAQALKPYADFASLRASREATILSLAKSRFDWQRVMRELALVIPDDITITQLRGKATSADSTGGADSGSTSTGTDLSGGVAGPSLALSGCGKTQDAVARFVADLQDIDGVTRVGLARSEKRDKQAGGSVGSGNTDCRQRDQNAQFDILAAFDAVPTPSVAGAAPAAVTTTPTATPASAPASGSTGATGATGTPVASDGVSDGAAEIQASKDSAASQTDKAKKATGAILGTGK